MSDALDAHPANIAAAAQPESSFRIRSVPVSDPRSTMAKDGRRDIAAVQHTPAISDEAQPVAGRSALSGALGVAVRLHQRSPCAGRMAFRIHFHPF
jgi:hypothetical protein